MTMPAGAAPGRESLPWPPAPHPARTFRGARWVQTIARTVHIAAMGTVLGGVSYSVPERALAAAAAASIGSHMPKTWRHWSFLDHRVIE